MDTADFEKWCRVRRGFSTTTTGQYARRVRQAARWLDVPLSQARTADVLEWMDTLPATASSRNHARKALAAYYQWRTESRKRHHDPMDDVPAWKTPPGVPRPLSEDAARALRARALGDGGMTASLVMLMLHCGLRIGEATRVQGRDLDDGWLTVQGKGDRTRSLWVHPDVLRVLPDTRSWVHPSPVGTGPIHTTTARRLVQDCAGRAGIAWMVPHQCRHRLATDLLEVSRDIRLVADVLGHQDVSTTTGYARVRPGRMAQALEGVTYA